MQEKSYKVEWNKKATRQLLELYEYILQDSVQNADKVVADIRKVIKFLQKNPYVRSPDRYKRNNDGSYRYFIKHRYRISYRIAISHTIFIVRLRHTKQQVRFY